MHENYSINMNDMREWKGPKAIQREELYSLMATDRNDFPWHSVMHLGGISLSLRHMHIKHVKLVNRGGALLWHYLCVDCQQNLEKLPPAPTVTHTNTHRTHPWTHVCRHIHRYTPSSTRCPAKSIVSPLNSLQLTFKLNLWWTFH